MTPPLFPQTSPFGLVPQDPAPPLATVRGASGAVYQFQIHPIGTEYLPRSGVYIFVKIGANGQWDPIYIGETSSFQRRLYNDLRLHHQWPGIVAHRASHILTLHVPGVLALRENIETDIRQITTTPCNEQ
ncbi:hypothetical protein CVM73_18010 [Bradyrhizobium forestalis]|uniref:GIY-YIG domain-containing protein n=1 Tax=Bradyrhizobium forestalis TaxID=1419263 RepID=A0A2M8R7Y9_9BRAD|nr:hypothetical protein [Bradyrhizobium forestalis]PJG53945.1 hypothetical protein CVM73_18010 [Bradyrhizobium forestalis]